MTDWPSSQVAWTPFMNKWSALPSHFGGGVERIAAEAQRVAPEGPNDRHQAHQEHALHHHAQHVLLADQSAVEQGQARDRSSSAPGPSWSASRRCRPCRAWGPPAAGTWRRWLRSRPPGPRPRRQRPSTRRSQVPLPPSNCGVALPISSDRNLSFYRSNDQERCRQSARTSVRENQ